jgi:hypothetical protein
MVVLALAPLLLVVDSRPPRVRNGVTRPFVKTLPQKLGTGPAEMNPFLFPTPLRHGAIPLYDCSPALPLRSRCQPNAANNRGAITAPAPGSDSKIKKSGCAAAAASIFSSKSAMPSTKLRTSWHHHFHHRTLGFDHRPIPDGGNGLANRGHAALDEFLIPTAVLAEERAQLRRRNSS